MCEENPKAHTRLMAMLTCLPPNYALTIIILRLHGNRQISALAV